MDELSLTDTPEKPKTNDDVSEGEETKDAIDEIDTDDLLEEAEAVLPSRKEPKRRTKSTSRPRTTIPRSKAKKTKGEEMECEEQSGSETPKRKSGSTRRKPAVKKGKEKVDPVKQEKGKKARKAAFDPIRVQELNTAYPDTYWEYHADRDHQMINDISHANQLELVSCNMSDQAPITSMCLSPDGTLLATFSNIGAVKIWDITNDFALLRKLRDTEELNIDEFYCGQFISDAQALLATGGKIKDRHRWSAEDEDNHILPCTIKIFDIEESKVVSKLVGHSEEILCIKTLTFNGQNYYISTSQDGYIFKWHMDSDWITLIKATHMEDGITCMAFTVSFVPNTGNKYFMAACDEHLRLYDFEEAQLLQTFEDIYSSYCDCGKFIKWLDEPIYAAQQKNKAIEESDSKEEIEVESVQEKKRLENYAWFISRGAEMCDVGDGVSSKDNTCTLHRLVYPTQAGDTFKLEEVKKYKHEDYHANSWLVKITSNGRYILAPTIYGQIFVFNLLTGQLSAILKDHEGKPRNRNKTKGQGFLLVK
ncbi:WD40-repeat-containing domain protein [Spinellus fusiger]|nr:WD40-repeat-containing domain protein [Spinellus fusiger]